MANRPFRTIVALAGSALFAATPAGGAGPTRFADDAPVSPPIVAGAVHVSGLLPECAAGQCTVDVSILAVADFTGDGLADLLLGTTMSDRRYREIDKAGPVVLMKNLGGTFAQADFAEGKPFLLAKHPREAAVADFNGDGRADVAIVTNGFDVAPWRGSRNLLLLQEGDTLRDASANLPDVVAMHHGIAAGDFAGNGRNDLMVITNHGTTRVNSYFLVNDGSGRFAKSDLPDRFPPSFLRNETGGGKDRAKYDTALLADLDGDGRDDILLAQSGDDARKATRFKGFRDTRIVFNDGSGRWPRENTYQLPPGHWAYATFAEAAAVADVDGDGRPDLLMATQGRGEDYPWLGQRLRLFLNRGGRQFEEVTETHLWDQSRWDKQPGLLAPHVALKDINGDGHVDIVLALLSPVRGDQADQFPYPVALNDGRGHFTPVDPTRLGEAFRGRQLWPIDASGDGGTDLVGLSLIGDRAGEDFLTRGVKIDLYEGKTASQ